uniref:Uncharacterized protein n=1 Tax=Meloidogyne enterolobii TaxID=390850 RepID=A0A6V7X790_MELEN|nr:unnamed protein product [Meloidogyne enterolobii]
MLKIIVNCNWQKDGNGHWLHSHFRYNYNQQVKSQPIFYLTDFFKTNFFHLGSVIKFITGNTCFLHI